MAKVLEKMTMRNCQIMDEAHEAAPDRRRVLPERPFSVAGSILLPGKAALHPLFTGHAPA